jgi:carbon monoxide dehydrogenase subunit G
MPEIRATRVVPQSPERVFEFLSDLRNHWRLESSFVELEALHDDALGGRVRMKGPLGLGRTASTRVLVAEAPRTGTASLRGRAEIGASTVGLVRWDVVTTGGGSAVSLAATVERAGLVDRIVLALGGRAWLRALFERALANLETELARGG